MGDVPNRGPQLIAVVAVLLTFSLTAIILRCYVRISLVKAFGVDDYLMVFSTVSNGQTTMHYTRLCVAHFSLIADDLYSVLRCMSHGRALWYRPALLGSRRARYTGSIDGRC